MARKKKTGRSDYVCRYRGSGKESVEAFLKWVAENRPECLNSADLVVLAVWKRAVEVLFGETDGSPTLSTLEERLRRRDLPAAESIRRARCRLELAGKLNPTDKEVQKMRKNHRTSARNGFICKDCGDLLRDHACKKGHREAA